MPDFVQCTSGKEVVTAYETFIAALDPPENFAGHFQIAKDFANCMPGFFMAFRNKQEFWTATDNGKVVGLLRLELQEDAVHIAQVVSLPGYGSHLVSLSKQRAIARQKSKVNLNTADEKLPGYYRKFGFEMVTKGAMTGDMEVDANK
jgi:hypothetical protein